MATTTPTAPATPAAPKTIRYVAVTMFPELLTKLQDATKATPEHGEISLGTYVRDMLCEHFKIAKPATTRAARRTYANEAEKKAAKKAIRDTRAKILADLMAKHAAELQAAIAKAEAEALAKVRAEASAPPDDEKPNA